MKMIEAAARLSFKILVHKACVGFFCFKAGLYWRGLAHDLSKFHPAEFLESVRFYDPKQSPVNAAKAEFGWSRAWQHHKGMNSHHYEYWVDDIDHGTRLIRMPFEDALELVCDWLGASIAYNWKLSGLYEREWNWWTSGPMKNARMHPHTRAFIHSMLRQMRNENSCDALQNGIARLTYDSVLSLMPDIPVSCPIEDCIWKEPESKEDRKFWLE